MRIILIAGQAGVGKSTAAKLIAEKAFDQGFVPILLSFAGALKKEAEDKGYSKKENPEKYREYCQLMGATHRETNPDYWVELLNKDVEGHLIKEKESFIEGNKYWERCVIVDDCRYINELLYGIERNAIRVFLSKGKRILTDFAWRNHESEELANTIESHKEGVHKLFNTCINNDRDIKKLRKIIRDLTSAWLTSESELSENMELYTEMTDLLDLYLFRDEEEEDE
jgi:hypothetical protein